MTEAMLETMIGGIAAATAAAVAVLAAAGMTVEITEFDVDASLGSEGGAPRIEAGVVVRLASRRAAVRAVARPQAS